MFLISDLESGDFEAHLLCFVIVMLPGMVCTMLRTTLCVKSDNHVLYSRFSLTPLEPQSRFGDKLLGL